MKFVLFIAAAVILVRDPTGKWAGDPLQPWFESLRNKAGLYCCAQADGHPLDDGVQGKWEVVPDDALILSPNKLGKAIVWFPHLGELAWGGDTRTPIWCFIPGSGV